MMRVGDVIITPMTYCWGLSWIVTRAGGRERGAEAGRGSGWTYSEVWEMGSVFSRESRKCKSLCAPQN